MKLKPQIVNDYWSSGITAVVAVITYETTVASLQFEEHQAGLENQLLGYMTTTTLTSLTLATLVGALVGFVVMKARRRTQRHTPWRELSVSSTSALACLASGFDSVLFVLLMFLLTLYAVQGLLTHLLKSKTAALVLCALLPLTGTGVAYAAAHLDSDPTGKSLLDEFRGPYFLPHGGPGQFSLDSYGLYQDELADDPDQNTIDIVGAKTNGGYQVSLSLSTSPMLDGCGVDPECVSVGESKYGPVMNHGQYDSEYRVAIDGGYISVQRDNLDYTDGVDDEAFLSPSEAIAILDSLDHVSRKAFIDTLSGARFEGAY